MSTIAPGKPQEKKLWGAPLKIKQLEEEIALLKAQIEELGGSPYELEPWQHQGDTRTKKGVGEPCRWRHFHANGEDEWLYHEKMTFWSDSGWGEYVQERAQAAITNAFGGFKRPDGSGIVRQDVRLARIGPLDRHGEQTYVMFPTPFSPHHTLEVIVRLRKGEKPVGA